MTALRFRTGARPRPKSSLLARMAAFPPRRRIPGGTPGPAAKPTFHKIKKLRFSRNQLQGTRIMMGERALIPGYVKLPPSTVGIGGPLVPPLPSFPRFDGPLLRGQL